MVRLYGARHRISVMSLDIIKKHFRGVQLKQTSTILKTYTGESIEPVGQAQIHVRLQKKKKILQLFVVKEGKIAYLAGHGSKPCS